MKFVFRKAEATDEDRIRALFIEMLQSICHTDEVNGYEAGYLDKFFRDREDRIYVAEVNDMVIAFLSVEVYRDAGYIYLDDLSVTEAHRNVGVGTQLIRMAETYAREIDIPVIVFHVVKTNERAHRLYQRLGYADHEDQGNRIRMIKEIEIPNYKNKKCYRGKP